MYNFKSLKWKLTVWLMLFLSFFNGVQVFAISAVNIYNEANIYSEINSLFSHDSALEEATVLGEDISKRTENEKHFRMSDGSMIAVTYDEDVHYLKDGKYEEIDNSLTSENDEYGIKGSSTDIKFSKKAKENKILTIKNSDLKLTWGLKGITKSEGKVTNLNENLTKEEKLELNKKFEVATKTGIITYENVFANTDLRYTVLAKGVKEEIVLKTKDSINNSFVFTADIKDVKAKLEEDNTIVFTKNGKEVFVIEAPYMYDANDNYSQEITLKLDEVKKGYEITLIPNKEWLEDENRVFPVVIDPIITTTRNYQHIKDTWIYSGDTNNNGRHTQHILRVGAKTTLSNDAHRTLIKFDLPELNAGDQVIDAEFNISNYHDTDEWNPPTETRQIDVHKMTKSWVDSTAHWKNLSTSFESEAADYFMYSYSSSNKNKTNSVDITKMVKEWYTTGNNYGLMLKEHKENISTQKQSIFFLSANTGSSYQNKRPVVYITYRNQTGLESYLSYHKYNTGRGGTIYTNDYNGNLVLIHPDVATLGGVFPVSLNHVYNVNDKGVDIGYGNGFRLNLTQTLETMTISSVEYAKYVDEDGTAHYFYKEDGKYYDEDGQGLTLTLSNNVFTLKDKSGNMSKFESYSGKWRLTEIINTANQNVTIEYSGAYISKIIDYTQQEILLSYSNNKLTTVTDPTGRIWTYNYSGNNLVGITYPDNEQVTYTYNSNLLTSVSDIDGSKITIEYYPASPYRVKKISEYGTDGTEGSYLSISYATNSTKFIDSENNILYYNFSNLGTLTSTADYGTTIDLNEVYGQSAYYGRTEKTQYKPILTYNATQPIINMIKDNSAELDDNSWWLGNKGTVNATVEKTTTASLYGQKSMKITSADVESKGKIAQNISNLESGTYTFSAHLKAENITSNDGGAYLIMYYDDPDGNVIYKKSEYITGTKDWKRYNVSLELPNAVTTIGVAIEMINATGTVYIDGLQFETGNSANLYNIVENGNFMYDESNWTRTLLSSADSLREVNGANVFRINGDANTRKNIYQTLNISGKAGDSFTFGCWVRNNGPKNYGTRNCELIIGFVKTNGEIQWLGTKISPDSEQWQSKNMYVTAEADFTQIKLFVANYYTLNYMEVTNIYGHIGGDKQLYDYDAEGNLLTTTDGQNDVDANVYSASNRLVGVKTFNGSSFAYEYDLDVKDRLTKAVDNYLDINYEFKYDYYGNEVETAITIDDAAANVIPGKTYFIESSASNRFVDDYARNENNQGLNYLQNIFTGESGQKYLVEEDEYGWYTVKTNNGSNKYFTVDESGYLIMSDYTGEYNQKFIFEQRPDGSYCIISIENNNAMELEKNSNGKGVKYIFKNEYENKETQRFKFREYNIDKSYEKYGLESNEIYRIKVKSSGLYLDHNASSATDYLVQNKLNEEKESQLFRIVRINENNYKIIPYDSEVGEAIGTGGANTANSKAVISDFSATSQDQIWKIKQSDAGIYTIESTQAGNLMLGLQTAVTTENTSLVLNSSANQDKQKFYFEKVGIFDIQDKDFYELTINGTILTNDESSNVVLVDEAYSLWRFINLNNGYYIIENIDDGRVITVDADGTHLVLQGKDTTYTNLNQQFELTPNGNDCIKIKPRIYLGKKALRGYADENGYYLTIENSETMHNQNAYFDVQLWLKGTISTSKDYTYDGKFLWREYDEFGNITEYDYDDNGRLNSLTDRNGNITNYAYDTMYRMTQVNKGNASVIYTYNKDKLTQISNNNYYYTLVYDVFGNLATTKIGDRVLSSNIYDVNNGKLLSSTYGNNQTINYQYDRFNRISKKVAQDNEYLYYYDKKGNLSSIVDNNGKKEYIYDISNRLITYSYKDYSTKYEYDVDSNLSRKVEVLNDIERIYEYNYDKAGRLNSFKFDGTLHMYNYDKYSRLHSSSIQTDYAYNTKYLYYKNVGGNCFSNIVEEVVENGIRTWYNYDSNGNIIEILVNDETMYEYEYDSFNRLAREHNKELNKTIEYVYDAGSNLINKKEYNYKTTTLIKQINYTYDSSWKDLLTSYDNKPITTDVIGNLLSYDGKTYTWKNGRQLASISAQNGDVITYDYNEEGIRISKTINGIKTTYELEGTNVVAERTGNIEIYYIYDGSGELVGFEYDGQKYYYTKNIQGDITGIMNSFLEKVVEYKYDSWGQIVSIVDSEGQIVTSNTHIGCINPYRYRGYRYDNETGLYYLQSRYYNPEWGRFISADGRIGQMGEIESLNTFAYCLNNPINMADENGDVPHLILAAGVGAIVGLLGQFGADLLTSAATGEFKLSNWQTYAGSAVGGAVGGVLAVTLGPAVGKAAAGVIAGAIGGGSGTLAGQALENVTNGKKRSAKDIATNVIIDTAIGGVIGSSPLKVNKITAGRGSAAAVYKTAITKLKNKTIQSVSIKTVLKGITSEYVSGEILNTFADVIKNRVELLWDAN